MNGSTPPRDHDYRRCYNDTGDESTVNEADTSRQPWGVAPVDFVYSIESDFSLSSLSLWEQETLLDSLSAAVVESVYEYACLPERGRKRRRQSVVSSSPLTSASNSRRTEILSISPGNGHEWLGECSSYPSSIIWHDSFCVEIHGTVVIAFDGNDESESTIPVTDFDAVGNVVLSRIKEDMSNGKYISDVNNDLLRFGMSIRNMTYIESEYPDLVAGDAFDYLNTGFGKSQDDMTLFSKVAIPIMVILFLLAMGLCWLSIKSCPTEFMFMQRNVKKQKGGDNKDNSWFKDSRNAELSNRRIQNNSRNVDGTKERSGGQSLTRTQQDLSNNENLAYETQHVMNSNSTHPRQNSLLSRTTNRFLSASMRRQARRRQDQTRVQVADSNIHPSDTETGSSGRSGEMDNDLRDLAQYRNRDNFVNGGVREKVSRDDTNTTNQNSMPSGIMSSVIGGSDTNEISQVPGPAMSLMDRIRSCTSIRSNYCLGDDPSSQTDGNNKDSTVLRYVVPSVERNNSLLDDESSSPSVPSRAIESIARKPKFDAKKSAAYRDYINKKMLQRNSEYEQTDLTRPMEIGVKRTFTDAQGRIREMVAL